MFTAKDMHKKLKALDVCEGIDAWIEEDLYKAFNRFGRVATVNPYVIGQYGWSKKGFIQELSIRGFHVEHKLDQKDGDYYEITYPPQEL